MIKLVFVTEMSPIYEDRFRVYSRLRFYSDTLVKLATSYSCDEISVIYPESCNLKGRRSYCREDLDLIDTSDLSRYENCNYLKLSSESEGINVSFDTAENFIESNKDVDFILTFGILNGDRKGIYSLVENVYSRLIDKSLFYHYLSSDAELTESQYILDGRTSFLSEFDKFSDQCVKTKLKSVIITEVDDPNILDNYSNVGITRVDYLPVVVNYEQRVCRYKKDANISNENGAMILKGLDQWSKESPFILEIFRDNLEVYESSMPALRRKLLPIAEKYGLTYRHARFWTIDKMNDILSKYSYYVGASSPKSSRFTYKLIESAASSTLCLLPSVTLTPLKIQQSLSGSLLEKYSPLLGTLEDSTKLSNLVRESSDDETYRGYLEMQDRFIKEYFDINSENINYLVSKIIK